MIVLIWFLSDSFTLDDDNNSNNSSNNNDANSNNNNWKNKGWILYKPVYTCLC